MDPKKRRDLFRRQRKARALAQAIRGPAPAVAAREVTMTELDRRAAAIVRSVREGEVAVVSRHKRAVAMIVPLDDELELVLRDPSKAEGMAELMEAFKRRADRRHGSAVFHGRWAGQIYRRYRRQPAD
jgi:antitoxin (DNA-binding transcriptional repressor) of toxin-antitoxin stability system